MTFCITVIIISRYYTRAEVYVQYTMTAHKKPRAVHYSSPYCGVCRTELLKLGGGYGRAHCTV